MILVNITWIQRFWDKFFMWQVIHNRWTHFCDVFGHFVTINFLCRSIDDAPNFVTNPSQIFLCYIFSSLSDKRNSSKKQISLSSVCIAAEFSISYANLYVFVPVQLGRHILDHDVWIQVWVNTEQSYWFNHHSIPVHLILILSTLSFNLLA